MRCGGGAGSRHQPKRPHGRQRGHGPRRQVQKRPNRTDPGRREEIGHPPGGGLRLCAAMQPRDGPFEDHLRIVETERRRARCRGPSHTAPPLRRRGRRQGERPAVDRLPQHLRLRRQAPRPAGARRDARHVHHVDPTPRRAVSDPARERGAAGAPHLRPACGPRSPEKPCHAPAAGGVHRRARNRGARPKGSLAPAACDRARAHGIGGTDAGSAKHPGRPFGSDRALRRGAPAGLSRPFDVPDRGVGATGGASPDEERAEPCRQSVPCRAMSRHLPCAVVNASGAPTSAPGGRERSVDRTEPLVARAGGGGVGARRPGTDLARRSVALARDGMARYAAPCPYVFRPP